MGNKADLIKLALAHALYALNGIAEREGFENDNCEHDDSFCCGLCEEIGCLDYKRRLLRMALLPKTMEDFGFPDTSRGEK